MAVALLATFYGAALANLFCLPIADKLQLKLARRGDQPQPDHRRHADDPRGQEPDAGARDAARLSAGKASPRRQRTKRTLAAGLTAARRERRTRAWRRKKAAAHGGGGHGWFVTFADLMGLLVAFFVMLVAFSTQDAAKLQVVAGSMRDAFGVQNKVRYSGHHRDRRSADTPEAEKRGAHHPGGSFRHAHRPTKAAAISTSAPSSSRTARSRWPRLRCARRCRTCRRSQRFRSTS